MPGLLINRWIPTGDQGIVVMTNELIDVDSTIGLRAGVRWNTDGTIDSREEDTYGPINPGEWWSTGPRPFIGESYEVRALSAGKTGTWSSAAAPDDVWILMDAPREWNIQQVGVGQKITVATFEIRLAGSGSALDSAVYDVRAEQLPP